MFLSACLIQVWQEPLLQGVFLRYVLFVSDSPYASDKLLNELKICKQFLVERLYLGMHYPFDVLVGIAWGALVGLLLYLVYLKVYDRMFPDVEFISSQYTSKGYTIITIDIVLLTMSLLFLYAILRSFIS